MLNKTPTHKSRKSNANVRKARSVVPSSRHVAPQVNSADALAKTLTVPASDLSATDIVALQQTVGNSAVRQLLSSSTEPSSTYRTSARPVIQAKLAIGPANDHFEQEADRIAKEATSYGSGASQETVHRHSSPLAASITPLQAKTDPSQVVAESGFETRLRARRGSGSRLPESVRSHMESRLGADFSDVRIHTDSGAKDLNREIGARAFTYGTDIYFRPGAFDPGSKRGQQLLAHELTHVVQQGAAGKGDQRAQRTTTSTSGERRIQRNGSKDKTRHLFDKFVDPVREEPTLSRWQRFKRFFAALPEKKETVYDPMQGRQKPGLIAAGVGGLGSITVGAGGLTDLLASSSNAAAGAGLGAGGLGAIAGPINTVSGLYNAAKADDPRQRREGLLSSAAGLGQTFTGTALGVQSMSKLGIASGFTATSGAQFLSSAVLPAQIAMGGVDVVRGGYGLWKAHSRQKQLDEYSRGIGSRVYGDFKDKQFVELAAKYQGKRKRTAVLNTLSGAAAVAGGSLMLTGVGIPVGIALLIGSGLLKAGALFGGKIREKFLNAKNSSYGEDKQQKENDWAEHAAMGIMDNKNQTVMTTLLHMGVHGDTIERIRTVGDKDKRKAILRSLLMRR
ncbi:MAG TPA: DUF4157 domain-containing protein [Blastocatellia bacterium]|nr:DUF4157 domain-containing protein [Blastocatellia bacterium]